MKLETTQEMLAKSGHLFSLRCLAEVPGLPGRTVKCNVSFSARLLTAMCLTKLVVELWF